ncbi:hypothetical protein JOF34_001480 [Microbacterium amylolyticum]|uniref:Phage L5-like integrase N-terminal domain-containing protein n=1 Tax=Microbacterium amylolyticum TaxID=936337 RepID=A0ABS4ZHZ8_9MICO|nr:hypothetical protein [Microbacterium amylolyticum]
MARGWHLRTFPMEARRPAGRDSAVAHRRGRATSCRTSAREHAAIRRNTRMLVSRRIEWHGVGRTSNRVQSSPREGMMRGTRRETWGSLRKLPSGRWQARYPAPDGEMYTARTDDDKALTFVSKTDARKWLSSMHSKISLGLWEPPAVVAKRRRAEIAGSSQLRVSSGLAGRWPDRRRGPPRMEVPTLTIRKTSTSSASRPSVTRCPGVVRWESPCLIGRLPKIT